jgi:predicted outer membrane repeat protein
MAGAAGRWAARLAAALVLATALAPSARGAFVVTSTADGGAGSLRDAIASADASPGADEITFSLSGCPCTIALASPLAVHDDLTITGPGAGTLALDGGNAVRVLEIDAAVPVAVSDLTVQHGNGGAANGGGIFATPGATLTLTRVTVQDSTATSGGGIFAEELTATGVTVQNDTATSGSGGGIYATGALSLTGATVAHNTARDYGGGALSTASATVVDSTFDSNTATGFDGGGLYVSGQVTASGSLFVGNSTLTQKGYGGGGGLIAFGQASISSTTFRGNTSSDWGGGAYLAYFADTAPTLLTDVKLVSNSAQAGGGGGAFIWFEAILDSVEATDNYSSGHGGGVYGGYAGNYLLTVHGGRFLRNSGAGGGGIYSDSDVSIDGTELLANTSRNGNGGALWTPANATVANATVQYNVVLMGGNSGGIDTSGNLEISDSTVSDNETLTGNGGGSGTGGNATVTNSHYLRNVANGVGGGLIAYGSADVSGGSLEDNSALTNWGGGLYASQASTVTDTDVLRNTSEYAGGGVAVQSGTLQVTRGRFEGNQATGGGWGGAIYCNGATLTVEETQFLSNQADVNGGAIAANGVTLDRAVLIGNQGGTGGGLWQQADATIDNSLFADNHAVGEQGEAMRLGSGTVTVRHATITSSPARAGSAIYVDSATVQLLNSIVTAHGDGVFSDAGTVLADVDLFWDVGMEGEGADVTITAPVTGDPLFVDPTAGDYHLRIGSPAIDAGPAVGVVTDIDGDPRPQGAGYDLGYDEVVVPEASSGTQAAAALLGLVAVFRRRPPRASRA